jgi:hypothetical protein
LNASEEVAHEAEDKGAEKINIWRYGRVGPRGDDCEWEKPRVERVVE